MAKITGKPPAEKVKRQPPQEPNLFIDCKIERIETDPTQYRPYSPILVPEDAYVRVPVADPNVERDGQQIILSLEGFTAFLSTIATAIDVMHHQRQTNVQKIYNER